MAIGQKMTIKVHENEAGTLVFDSVSIVDFNHSAGFTGATTVVKNDFAGTANDEFTVQVTTDSGNLFSASQTLTQIKNVAKAAVIAEYGSGPAGTPS